MHYFYHFLIHFIFTAANWHEVVKFSFTTSFRSSDMLMRALSGQLTAESSSSNASLPPRGKHVLSNPPRVKHVVACGNPRGKHVVGMWKDERGIKSNVTKEGKRVESVESLSNRHVEINHVGQRLETGSSSDRRAAAQTVGQQPIVGQQPRSSRPIGTTHRKVILLEGSRQCEFDRLYASTQYALTTKICTFILLVGSF